MPKPSKYYVIIYTPDPAEEGPDEETEFPMASRQAALQFAKAERAKIDGKDARAFERKNIRVPEYFLDEGIYDPPPYEWDCDEAALDEQEE